MTVTRDCGLGRDSAPRGNRVGWPPEAGTPKVIGFLPGKTRKTISFEFAVQVAPFTNALSKVSRRVTPPDIGTYKGPRWPLQ